MNKSGMGTERGRSGISVREGGYTIMINNSIHSCMGYRMDGCVASTLILSRTFSSLMSLYIYIHALVLSLGAERQKLGTRPSRKGTEERGEDEGCRMKTRAESIYIYM